MDLETNLQTYKCDLERLISSLRFNGELNLDHHTISEFRALLGDLTRAFGTACEIAAHSSSGLTVARLEKEMREMRQTLGEIENELDLPHK